MFRLRHNSYIFSSLNLGDDFLAENSKFRKKNVQNMTLFRTIWDFLHIFVSECEIFCTNENK